MDSDLEFDDDNVNNNINKEQPKNIIESDDEIEENNNDLNENFIVLPNANPINNVPDFEITTDGIEYDVFKNLTNIQKQTLFNCSTCGQFYQHDLRTNLGGEDTCYHCYYWMHYSPDVRAEAEQTQALKIADYILKCRSHHAYSKCTKNTNYGGCFICDHIQGMPIENIMNGNKVNIDEIVKLDDTKVVNELEKVETKIQKLKIEL